MGKLGSLIGKTIVGVISIAATAVISVLVQRYVEALTKPPASSTPLASPRVIEGTTEQNANEVEPVSPLSAEQPLPDENVRTAPLSEVEFPNPLTTETRIDPSVAAEETAPEDATVSDAPVGISLEDPSRSSKSQDSSIMDTFWEKLKNK